jgi:hypothetical protein
MDDSAVHDRKDGADFADLVDRNLHQIGVTSRGPPVSGAGTTNLALTRSDRGRKCGDVWAQP